MLKQLKDKFCNDELAIEVLFDEVCCSYSSSIMFCKLFLKKNPYGILRFNYRVAVVGRPLSDFIHLFLSSFIIIPENFSLYNCSMVYFQTDSMDLLFCGFAVINL